MISDIYEKLMNQPINIYFILGWWIIHENKIIGFIVMNGKVLTVSRAYNTVQCRVSCWTRAFAVFEASRDATHARVCVKLLFDAFIQVYFEVFARCSQSPTTDVTLGEAYIQQSTAVASWWW